MIVYMVSVDLSGLLWLWVGYLISVFDHVLLKSTLVIRPLAQLHQYVKVTVFLRQRRNPLMLTQLHCHNHRQHNYIKHIVCSDLQLIWPHGQDHIKGTNYKTLTERCEQLRAFLRVLVLQRDVALLLCGAVERRQLSHVTAQQRVQQRHQLLAQHGAQLHVCVRIHRAQD